MRPELKGGFSTTTNPWHMLGCSTHPRGAVLLTLSSALPMNLVTRMQGQKRLNSLHQLPSVDFGVMTMWGPVMPLNSRRYATSEIVCSVFPRP